MQKYVKKFRLYKCPYIWKEGWNLAPKIPLRYGFNQEDFYLRLQMR